MKVCDLTKLEATVWSNYVKDLDAWRFVWTWRHTDL